MNRLFLSALPLVALAGISPLHAQSPTSLPGLRVWLDAQDGATISTAGGLVVQWDDKSGSGNHATQPDGLRQPVVNGTAINGQQGIRFDGAAVFASNQPTDDGLFINQSFSLGRAYSVFLVSQYWGGVQARTLQGRDDNWLTGNWNGSIANYTGNFVGANRPAGTFNPVATLASGSLTDSVFQINGTSNGRIGNVASPGRLLLGTPMAGNGVGCAEQRHSTPS